MSSVIARLDEVDVDYRVGGAVVQALRGATMEIVAGTSTAIVGRSGSGKSTLVSVLALLRQPTRGTVQVAQQRVTDASDSRLADLRASYVGTVFQSFHLDPAFSAMENVLLSWYLGIGGSRRRAETRALTLLEAVGIPELARRRTGAMSGGQRQRVAIARALFNDPVLLIADEPTGNLDEDTASEVADLLFSLPKSTGTALVVVTHDPEVASRAESSVTIAHGVLDSTPEWARA